jgi:hypothetical protein
MLSYKGWFKVKVINSWMVDVLLFYVSLKDFSHICGDVTIKRRLNVNLCLALDQGLEQRVIFIMSLLQWHSASVFPLSFKEPPYSVAFYDIQVDVDDLF